MLPTDETIFNTIQFYDPERFQLKICQPFGYYRTKKIAVTYASFIRHIHHKYHYSEKESQSTLHRALQIQWQSYQTTHH